MKILNKEKKINKWKIGLIAAVLTACFLIGCSGGNDDLNETTLIINSKGEITHHIVETFDKSYYNEDELRSLINKQIEDYCKDKGDDKLVRLKDLKVLDGKATAELTFKDYSNYAEFNDVDLFYGTIEEAMAADYTTDVTLKNVDSDETIDKYEFESLKDKKIIVIGEPILIKTPGKIAYITANIEVIDKDICKMASDSVGVGYIVLK